MKTFPTCVFVLGWKEIVSFSAMYSYLLYPVEGGYLQYQLMVFQDGQGYRILIEYGKGGYLSHIIDSAGRKLSVMTNEDGRITEVALNSPDGDRHVLVQYRYSTEQDLTEIADGLGQTTYLFYRNHMMLQKTDRNKAFIDAMNSDPVFRRDMLGRYPDFVTKNGLKLLVFAVFWKQISIKDF